MIFRHLRIAAIATALLPIVSFAQQPTPEALAQQQLEAVNRGDWAAYAANMHPKSLGRLQEMMMPIIDMTETKSQRAGEEMRGMLFGSKSAADLKKMSPQQFFETFMSSVTKFPGMADALKNARGEILGQVKEGENTVHIVTRTSTSIPGIPTFSKMEVMSFEREGDQWKGLLSGEMELQLGQLMQQVAAATSQEAGAAGASPAAPAKAASPAKATASPAKAPTKSKTGK